jgi:hypothetical protein
LNFTTWVTLGSFFFLFFLFFDSLKVQVHSQLW